MPDHESGVSRMSDRLTRLPLNPDFSHYSYITGICTKAEIIFFLPSYFINTTTITISNIGYCGIDGVTRLTPTSVTKDINGIRIKCQEDLTSYVGYAALVQLLNV